MNYLAHMVVGHWAGLDEKGVLGNFMGDAVKGRDVEGMWGVDVGRGIRLHRAIDDVSDRHEASREARKLLRETCGKWSGVVWDVLVDHVLARTSSRSATGCGALTDFAGSHEAEVAAQRDDHARAQPPVFRRHGVARVVGRLPRSRDRGGGAGGDVPSTGDRRTCGARVGRPF